LNLGDVSNRGGISSYRINPSTGLLSPAGSAVITGDPSGQLSNLVVVDPSGRFVYVSNGPSNDIQPDLINSAISAYVIDAASGALTPVGTPVDAHMWPASLTVHPTGKFLFAAVYSTFGPGEIMSFTIDQATGALTFASGIDASPYPTVLNLDPSGKFAYVTHEGGGESVSTYTIDPTTGALSFVSSTAAGPQPYGITVDPSSRFAYVTNIASDNLSTYTINATTGALSATGTSVMTGEHPSQIVQDPTGRFLYVTTSDNVRAYAINPATGALSSVAVAAGTRPGSIATTRTIE
jgi:6-phosphogluconolactonase (cycloisomerase 2 family)